MIMMSIIISNLLLWWNIIQNDTVEKYNIIWDVVEHNMIQEIRWCNVRWNMTRCAQTNTKMISQVKSCAQMIIIINLLHRDHLYWLPPQEALVQSLDDHYKQLHIAVYDKANVNKIMKRQW